MQNIILDGAAMESRRAMHDTLAEAFSLPAYYGRNLDALWDCLTERSEPLCISFLSPERMPEELFRSLAALLLDFCRASGSTVRFSSPAAMPGRYRHFKGGEYECFGIALHSETLLPVVTYRALYGSGGLWVRPAAMWSEAVGVNGTMQPRFTRIEEDEN